MNTAMPVASTHPRLTHLLAFAAAYVLGAWLGHSTLVIPGGTASLWPPSGIYLAALLMSERRHWAWWLLLALPAELLAGSLLFRLPVSAALGVFAGNTLEAFAGAWMIQTACGARFRLRGLREVLVLTAVGAVLAPMLSATLGAWVLSGSQSFVSDWTLIWIGDGLGMLIVAPLTLTLAELLDVRRPRSAARWGEAAAMLGTLVAAAHVGFSGLFPYAYLVFPPLIWAALRFGVVAVSTAMLVLACMASLYTASGLGPFASRGFGLDAQQALLQLWLAILAVSSLIVAALTRQRADALRALQQSHDELERRVAQRTAELARAARLDAFRVALNDALRPLADAAAIQAEAARLLGEHLGATRAHHAVVSEDGRETVVARDYCNGVHSVVGTHRLDDYGPLLMARIRSGQTLVVCNVNDDARLNPAERDATRALQVAAYVLVPLRKSGGTVALFAVHQSVPRDWQPDEIALIEETAERTWASVERSRAEDALRTAYDSFRHLLQNSPFGVYAVDADFRLTEVSVGAQRTFQSVRPLIGRDFAEVLRCIWPEPFASDAIARFRHTLHTGEPYHAPRTIERRHDSGDVEAYDWKIERVTLPDGRHGVVCNFYDLSERERHAQALRDADRRKDEFLATLAHELRNPLAPIGNAVQILRKAGKDEALAGKARDTIERQLRQLVRLVDDLLDVSRITRGRFELRRERTCLASIVDSAVETARPLLDAASHTLSVQLPDEPVWLDADLTRMAQVVANLLNNAVKYTPPGGRISLTAGQEGEGACIRVRDNGIGIPAAMQPRVFDMFLQGDAASGRARDGLGIGLTLVKRLVEMHGGQVGVHSDGEGRGSEFTVRIPALAALTPDAPARQAPQPVSSPLQPQFRRILVVDDNRDAADSMGLLLRMTGTDVRVAYDGAGALDLCRDFEADLAFLDIGMPGMNGYELGRRLRAARPQIVLVAVTGWGQEHDRRRTREAGFDHHLTKPVPAVTLEALLASSVLTARVA